jgi:uncharacterized protein involved in type VI secretion and phage assembly
MMAERHLADLVQWQRSRVYGKHRGLVVDNADPKRLGRLRLRVPGVTGPDVVTDWAEPCVPYGGSADQGMLFIPAQHAGVWVEYVQGDPDHPIWVGTFWSTPAGETEVPKADGAAQAQPTRKILRTAKGHTIQFEDKDAEEHVTVVEAVNGNVITMDKDGIRITDGANGHQIVLDGSGITLTDGKNAGNAITMTSDGVTVKTDGGVRVGSAAAAEPFVLGTQFKAQVQAFMIALSTHTHLGNLGGPTSPPSAAMSLDVPLSTKHTVE